MKEGKLRLKDIYAENKSRRYNEISGIKSNDAALISNPKDVLKKNKYKIIILAIIVVTLLLSTMYKDLPTFFITLAFLIGICLIVGIFNAFKITCSKERNKAFIWISESFFSV